MVNVAIIALCDFDKNPLGGEVFLIKSLLKNRRDDIKFYLVGITFNENEIVGQWNERNINGIRYEFLPVMKVSKEKEKCKTPFRLRLMLGLIKYKKNLKEKNLDMLYIHSADAILPFLFESKYKIISHIHGDPTGILKISRFKIFRKDLFNKLYTIIVNYQLIKSDKIIWAAQKCKELYYDKNPNMINKVENKSIVIHSCFDIDIDKYEKCYDKNYDLSKKYIITVGRLAKVKNIELILDALNEVSINDIHLLICGEGEERTYLESKVCELNLKDKVTFIGSVDRRELGKYLSLSEAFVFASRNEAMSLVVLESLYMGVPVVSVDVGDIPLVVKNNINGIIVEQNDYKGLAKAIDKVVSNGKEFYSKAAKESSMKYSPEVMASKIFDEIYRIGGEL